MRHPPAETRGDFRLEADHAISHLGMRETYSLRPMLFPSPSLRGAAPPERKFWWQDVQSGGTDQDQDRTPLSGVWGTTQK